MSSWITHNLSSSICLLGDAFCLSWTPIMSANIFLRGILLIVCLD